MTTIPASVSFARLSSQGFFSVDLAGAGHPDGRGGRPVVDGCAMEDSGDLDVEGCAMENSGDVDVVGSATEDSGGVDMLVADLDGRLVFDTTDVG